MAFVQRKRTKNDLTHLSESWDRLRDWIAEPTLAAPGTDEDFLELKKEIGQALHVLSTDFGNSTLNREAEQTAQRIRQFLAHLPTLESLNESRRTELEKLRRAWHGVFLLLSELSGAPEAEPVVPGRSAPLLGGGSAVPISGEPRRTATRFVFSRWISRVVYSVFSFVVLLTVLAIGFFFAERSGIFGEVSERGQLSADSSTLLGRIGAGWQSAQDTVAEAIPWLYNPIADYYHTHPEISVIAMVGLVGIFVGYLLFIRVD